MFRGRLNDGSREGGACLGGLGVLALVGIALFLGSASVWASGADSVVNVTVLDNSADRILLKYEIGDFRDAPVMIDGTPYQHLLLGTESLLKIAGAPEVPHICRSVIIPDDAEMAVNVAEAQYYELTNIDIVPSKGILSRTVNPDDVPYTFGAVYGQDAFFPGPLATLRAPYIMRDYRGLVVELNPLQYNPVTRTLRVYTEVILEVAAVGPGQVNVLERHPSELSLAFHQTYAHHFVNYRPASRYAPLDETGDMLIIAYDAWIPNVMPLADHKNAIGINTTVVGVSTIGNNATAIKNHIQGVYDSSDLAFVLLVGDGAQVDTPSASGGSSDPSYAKLAGGDDYPDIMVGRFSAESAADVDTQVDRTITYENLPATTQDWFWRGTGIASDQGAGIGDEGQSDIQHENEIRGWLMGRGYTQVDQIYDPSGTASQVSSALNSGRGVINYTGHGSTTSWSSTGFSNSHVNTLTNVNMLPFICSVACVNGQFDGYTCFGEAWLRATHNGEPTGAIAAYMSSINQSWAPPMEGQDEFNLLLSDDSEPCHSIGTLCFAASCSMMDDYGSDGVSMFNTWILFGDPSLRVVGTTAPPTGLKVTPSNGLDAAGPLGGPFTPGSIEYTLENYNETPINYTVSKTQPWVTLSGTGGTLPALGSTTVTVSINATANGLGNGNYADTVYFTNTTDHDGDTTRSVNLQVGGPSVIHQFPLDSDPGWSTQGQWAFGHPTGQGGNDHGNADPSNGATGSNVFGVNLSGDYSLTAGGPYYLTTGPIDLTDVEDVTLKFKRWLNSDYQTYVYATVEVSNNGSSWTSIWNNGTSEIADSSWNELEYDISAVADGQGTVYLRWGYQVGSYAWAYSGWNLDDVEIWGLATGSEPLNLIGSDPPDGALDARQALDPDTLEAQGWSSVVLYFDGPTNAMDPGKFLLEEVCEAGNCDGVAPALESVAADGLEAVLTFDRPIDPKAWTVIRYLEGGPDDIVRLGFLPADADESKTANANDIVQVVDYVNEAFGGGNPPLPLVDIDRSGEPTANDIAVLVDLLNGAGPFDVYLDVSLPAMP